MIEKVKKRSTRPDIDGMCERKRRIYDFLSGNPVGVLSTVSPDTNPLGTVIYYIVDTSFTTSFLTRVETHKHTNIKRNSHVMLTVFDPKTQTVVQISGRAVEVADSFDVNGIAGAVFGKSLQITSSGLMPINKLQAGPYTAYRIEPVQIRMAIYAGADSGEYSDIFDTIESFDLEL